jgi:hypothetical protein
MPRLTPPLDLLALLVIYLRVYTLRALHADHAGCVLAHLSPPPPRELVSWRTDGVDCGRSICRRRTGDYGAQSSWHCARVAYEHGISFECVPAAVAPTFDVVSDTFAYRDGEGGVVQVRAYSMSIY